jgi:crooked neck
MMPKKVKRRRQLDADAEEGGDAGWEEYYDYVFPDDIND